MAIGGGGTKLFRKPWGIPEFVLIGLVWVLLDAFTPSIDLLPFVSGYLEAIGAFIVDAWPG